MVRRSSRREGARIATACSVTKEPRVYCNHSTLALMRCLRPTGGQACLLRYLAYHGAPVLLKRRAAVLVTMNGDDDTRRRQWKESGAEMADRLGLSCFAMTRSAASTSVLLYDRTALADALSGRLAQAILRAEAYPRGRGPDAMLSCLGERFGGKTRPGEFPHEIGLFLGFPEKDVASFIRLRGRGYLFCGHWKVYHDLESALAKMRGIEAARAKAASMLLREENMDAIIGMLKAA